MPNRNGVVLSKRVSMKKLEGFSFILLGTKNGIKNSKPTRNGMAMKKEGNP